MRTFRSGNRVESRPTQLDYVFASEQLAAHAKCEVHDEAAAWALSDHAPIVVELPDG